MKVCLVASSGGHLSELLHVKEAYWDCERLWVTFASQDAILLLKNEKVVWAYGPTNRNLPNLLRNSWLSLRLLRKERPDVIISTGSGVGVPFIWTGYFLKISTIFIESLTFVDTPSLSGRLVYPFVDHYCVQWPELAEATFVCITHRSLPEPNCLGPVEPGR